MNRKDFLLGLFLTLWIGVVTISFIDYRTFFCINIDLGTHISIANYYAGVPPQDPAILCPNFIDEGRPIGWYNNHINSETYYTSVHKGIAMISIWTGFEPGHLLNWIGIVSMWLCFGLSCAIAHRISPQWWTLNLVMMVLTTQHIWRLVSNGWITQSLITLVMLGSAYWVVKSRRKVLVPIFITLGFLLLAFIHNPLPILLAVFNPLDGYRATYTLQFFVVPFLLLSWRWMQSRCSM